MAKWRHKERKKERKKERQEKARTLQHRKKWAVVVVKWSACSPSTLRLRSTIRVRIPLTTIVFLLNLCLKRTKINKIEAGVGPFFKKIEINKIKKLTWSWRCCTILIHASSRWRRWRNHLSGWIRTSYRSQFQSWSSRPHPLSNRTSPHLD